MAALHIKSTELEMDMSNAEMQSDKFLRTEQTIERGITRVLRFGALFSTVIMLAGVVLALVQGKPGGQAALNFLRFRDLFPGLLRLDPAAVTELGVLLLLFTPVARIAIAAIGFAAERDMKYMVISLGVLAVVLFSIAFAIEA
jgi:uncharacterized membrane protein